VTFARLKRIYGLKAEKQKGVFAGGSPPAKTPTLTRALRLIFVGMGIDMISDIAIGCDHAGFEYKEAIKAHLISKGVRVKDFGTYSTEPVDYPDFIRPVAEAVAKGDAQAGIVLGGSGNGEAIVSNKVRDIRCAVCWDEYTARMGKAHNDSNMISIGQRTVSLETALRIVDVWLETPFEGGRHQRRIDKVTAHDCQVA